MGEYMQAKLLQSCPAVVQEGLSGEEYLRGLHKGQTVKRNPGGQRGLFLLSMHMCAHTHIHCKQLGSNPDSSTAWL